MMLLCWSATALSAAVPGSSCDNPIPLTKDFTVQVDKAGTVWYSAWTFDLPIKVCFTPINPDFPAPDVEMDFSCTPGVYEDSILCSLFCTSSGSGVMLDMPHKPTLVKEGDDYCISMGKAYRDLLLQTGISYNLRVLVKVTFKSAGTLSMIPDTEFKDCMDGGKFTHLGDTIQVNANDKERFVILPYIQWMEDSVRYIWTGTKPVQAVVASTCAAEADDYLDERNLDRIDIQPGDTAQKTAAEIKYYAEYGQGQQSANTVQAGMLYGRFLSEASGVMKIERVPVAPPAGGATLLRYDRATTIMANDTDALYALRRDTVGVRFDSPTQHILRMYVGASADFTPATALASYQYNISDNGHSLMLFKEQLDALWTQTTGNYLYIRFLTTARTSVIPSVWAPSECAQKWDFLKPGELSVARSASGVVYHKLYYNQWRGAAMTFKWAGTAACPVFIGDTCGFPNNATNVHVVKGYSIKRNGTLTITAAEIEEWADRVDDEGNLYVMFYTSANGTMTISGGAPAETDPVYPGATVSVVCLDNNGKLQVSVSTDQHITIRNAAGAITREWDAIAGSPEQFTLGAGTYTLTGNNETITLQVP